MSSNLSGFERIKLDQGVIEDDEISISDFKALAGIARARLVLSDVPATLDVMQVIGNLESMLPPSGTPLSRAVYAAAHAHYNSFNHNSAEHYAGRDWSDPLEREGKAREGVWPA